MGKSEAGVRTTDVRILASRLPVLPITVQLGGVGHYSGFTIRARLFNSWAKSSQICEL